MNVGRPRVDRRKNECRDVDLTCDECIRRVAENVALLVPGSTGGQLRLYFQSMFPDENCQPMAQMFVQIALPAAPPRKAPRYAGELCVPVAAAVA